jgi:uncharacterized protein YuzE
MEKLREKVTDIVKVDGCVRVNINEKGRIDLLFIINP